MLTIRGVYDGKTFRALPNEPLPMVVGETPVEIVFLDQVTTHDNPRTENGDQQLSEKAQRLLATACSSRSLVSDSSSLLSPEEAGKRLDALRESIGPIGVSINELKDEGRYR